MPVDTQEFRHGKSILDRSYPPSLESGPNSSGYHECLPLRDERAKRVVRTVGNNCFVYAGNFLSRCHTYDLEILEAVWIVEHLSQYRLNEETRQELSAELRIETFRTIRRLASGNIRRCAGRRRLGRRRTLVC